MYWTEENSIWIAVVNETGRDEAWLNQKAFRVFLYDVIWRKSRTGNQYYSVSTIPYYT